MGGIKEDPHVLGSCKSLAEKWIPSFLRMDKLFSTFICMRTTRLLTFAGFLLDMGIKHLTGEPYGFNAFLLAYAFITAVQSEWTENFFAAFRDVKCQKLDLIQGEAGKSKIIPVIGGGRSNSLKDWVVADSLAAKGDSQKLCLQSSYEKISTKSAFLYMSLVYVPEALIDGIMIAAGLPAPRGWIVGMTTLWVPLATYGYMKSEAEIQMAQDLDSLLETKPGLKAHVDALVAAEERKAESKKQR